MTDNLSPEVIVFDVNETLSDMAPMAARFADVGAPAQLAATWFAAVLRDGFALTVVGTNPTFAELAKAVLATLLPTVPLVRSLDDATEHVMSGFTSLAVHTDVVPGVRDLAAHGHRLVTLSNGSSSVAAGLFDRAGLSDAFERLLSVEDAGVWKPAAGAYKYAARECAVAVEQMMLVAVHPWDIDGAHRAGLQTAWINRDGGRYPPSFGRPDVEVESVTELAQRLTPRQPR